MSGFFVSYTKADEMWAEWIGWVLEETGYSVRVQAWDFAAGGNFVLEMQRAASEAPRTIAVLSPNYLNSRFAAPEWAAAFAADPEGLKRRLVPVRVRECCLDGLWTAIVHIDLVGLDEVRARERLLDYVAGRRRKPVQRPPFPGSLETPHPIFPGTPSSQASSSLRPTLPKIRTAHSDLEKRRFLRETFDLIAKYFQQGLTDLHNAHPSIESEFNADGSSKFTAEIFVNGKSKQTCKIWITNQFGEGIAYFGGRDWGGSNTISEILSTREAEDGLVLSAHLSSAVFGGVGTGLDLKKLTPPEGAEYLWRRFVQYLEAK